MKLIKKSKWGLILLAATLIALGFAGATSLIKMDLNEVCTSADNIVIATVQNASCQYSEYDGKIYTYTKVHIDEVIKGEAAMTEAIVKTPGGSIGDVMMEVPDSPELTQGEQCIVFLYDADPEYLSNLVGFTQGKYSVVNGIIQENGKTVEEFINEIESIIDANEQ